MGCWETNGPDFCKCGKLVCAGTFTYSYGVLLNCSNAEAISQIAEDHGWSHVGELRFTGATLSGIVELGRASFHGGLEARTNAELALAQCPLARQTLRTVIAMFGGTFSIVRPQEHLFSAPVSELWLVRDSRCIESNEFGLFAHRFQRSLAQAGFGVRYPYALSQALLEMTENVVRHSGERNGPPALGVVGYHVTNGAMNYVVADLGRGVLRSLHENQKWRQLPTEGDALLAASRDGATRLVEQTGGDGFRVAFQAFLEREGVLAMRSGDGLVRLQGNMNEREAEIGNCFHLSGLRVLALCALNGKPEELKIEC